MAAFDRNQSVCGHCSASQSICDKLTLPSARTSRLEPVLKSPEKRRPANTDSCAKLSEWP
jgi:hypothetical protein